MIFKPVLMIECYLQQTDLKLKFSKSVTYNLKKNIISHDLSPMNMPYIKTNIK